MDAILQNQAVAALREITIQIKDTFGNPVNGIVLPTAALLIAKSGGNFVASAGATLTQVTGGNATDGLYRLRFALADVDTLGDLEYEITQTGVISPAIGYVPVVVATGGAVDATTIVNTLMAFVPDLGAPNPNFQTIQHIFNVWAAWLASTALGLPQAIAQQQTFLSLSGGKTRLATTISSGQRTTQGVDGT